jgi:hypothetical protein
MALQHLRSSTADKRPTPAAMSDGQLALNTNLVSPGLFFKDSNGDSVKIGPVHVGTTAPNATPGAGGQAGNSKGEAWLDTTATNPILKVWNGSAFVAVQPVGTGTVVSTTDTGTVTSTMILDGTILNADINASAAIVDTKLATIATAGKVSNSATTATNANTASAIVARDASGNFTAGTITAALTGAASSNVLKAGDTMTGALVHPLGAVGTPSITFTGDLNTGIWSPAADTVAASTAGSERLRIDSSGRLLVGTSSAFGTGLFQVAGSYNLGTYTANAFSSSFVFTKSRSTTPGQFTIVQANDQLGVLSFQGTDGASAIRGGQISCEVDGTPGANDMPGRLVFSTTADGASSPTERLRITSAGLVGIGTGAPAEILALRSSSSAIQIDTKRSNTTYGNAEILLGSPRSDTADGSTVAGRGLLSCLGNSTNTTGIVWLQAATASLATQLTDTDLKTKQCGIRLASDGSFEHWSSGSQRLKIDSSGRLLVGTSSARTVGSAGVLSQIESTSGDAGLSIVRNSNGNTGGGLTLAKSRGTSNGSSTIVQSGDDLGLVQFAGADGNDIASIAARIACQVDGTPGADDMPGRLVFSTTADGAATPTERLRITSAGLVGIGTSSPSKDLHIQPSADNGGILIKGSFANRFTAYTSPDTGAGYRFGYSETVGGLIQRCDADGAFVANAMVFDSSGNVGIGTTSPAKSLQVQGEVQIGTSGVSGTYDVYLYPNTSGQSVRWVRSDNGTLGLGRGTTAGVNEDVRIDSGGRLLVGMSTNYTIGDSSGWSVQVGNSAGISNLRTGNNSSPSYLVLAKTRATSAGSFAILQNNDIVGDISFAADDGTDYATNAAKIRCEVDGTPGANDMPGRLVFSTTADGSAGPTERMRIRQDGSVCLGKGISIGDGNRNVQTSIYFSGSVIASGAGNSTLKYSTSSGLVTYDTSSRLVKDNIVDCPYGLAEILQLQPRKYFRTDDQRDEIGFIADELVGVLPEFVPIGPKSVITKNENDTENIPLGVNYEKLTAVLTKALQEAMERIETLEAKVAALESA